GPGRTPSRRSPLSRPRSRATTRCRPAGCRGAASPAAPSPAAPPRRRRSPPPSSRRAGCAPAPPPPGPGRGPGRTSTPDTPRGGGEQGGEVGEAGQEPLEVRDDRGQRRLLEQDLRDQRPVGAGGPPPGQVALLAVVPAQQRTGEAGSRQSTVDSRQFSSLRMR